MAKHIKIIFVLLAFLTTPIANAALSPLSLNLIPPVQFPPDDFNVAGLRMSVLWGQHRDVYGIDLGLIGNITEQNFVGIGVSGLFNNTRGQTKIIGLQAAGLANVNSNKTDVYGAQLTLGINSNNATSTVTGIQLGLIGNLSGHTTIYGAQIGLYNKAQAVYGLQIGLVNVTKSLHGIQIGLANFNHDGPFAISPFLNIGF